MNNFEFDNYDEPLAMVAKKQDDDKKSLKKLIFKLKKK